MDFCTALDTSRGVDTLGMALQYDYGAFALSVATINIRCGQGGPVIPPVFDMESRPSSTSNACLESGVCVGVAKVRGQHMLSKRRTVTMMFRPHVGIRLSVGHMEVVGLVGSFAGTVGMKSATV